MTNKSMEFVEAATAIGASNGRLIFKHLLPNSLAFYHLVFKLIVNHQV